VLDVYSVSNCVNDDFADYIKYWKHNGYWLFDSPEIIQTVARENSIQLAGTLLFYYEVFEKEFDGSAGAFINPTFHSQLTSFQARGKNSKVSMW